MKVIIVGCGGHARVLADIVLTQSERYEPVGFVDNDRDKWGGMIFGIPVLGGDDVVFDWPADSVFLINAIGSTRDTQMRAGIFSFFKSKGYNFCDVVSNSSCLSRHAAHGEGLQLISGAIVHPGCRIGRNVLINTKTSVDHDCTIGDNVHIAPGATLSGGVSVGDGVHIGSGATVIQGVSIGSGALVAAGAVVTANVSANTAVGGVPAREITSLSRKTTDKDNEST
jgi:UDP-perosamine 4-acetyltransferase